MQTNDAMKETSAYRFLNAYRTINKYVTDEIKNPDALAIWVYAVCEGFVLDGNSIDKRFGISRSRTMKAISHLEEARLVKVKNTKETGKKEITEFIFFEFPYEA